MVFSHPEAGTTGLTEPKAGDVGQGESSSERADESVSIFYRLPNCVGLQKGMRLMYRQVCGTQF